MPPVVRLAGQAVDDVRRRRQQELHGHRGRKDDPLYRARRVLHTGADLLTNRQKIRLQALFTAGSGGDDHVEVEATWAVYQRMIAAYRDPDRAAGKTAMSGLIDSRRTKIPAALVEVRRLGRTLNLRAADVLAHFDRPGASNGPTEAINGRLEHLRGSALGSATSPTPSPDPSSRPAGSDPDYTLDREEPDYRPPLVAVSSQPCEQVQSARPALVRAGHPCWPPARHAGHLDISRELTDGSTELD